MCAFDLERIPDGVDDLMGDWIQSFTRKLRKMVLIGGLLSAGLYGTPEIAHVLIRFTLMTLLLLCINYVLF